MTRSYAGAGFPSTSWSLVAHAVNPDSSEARDAMERLCRGYYDPIHALIRRKWRHAEEALDLTQVFFARLLEKDTLARARREKGRLRDFLSKICVNFLRDEHRRKVAKGMICVSIDVRDAEGRRLNEPAGPMTPDREFEHDWVCTLLKRVLDRLAGEYVKPEQVRVFEVLKAVLTEGRGVVQRERLAEKLGMTDGAVHTASSRLRARYRKILEAEIASTLDDPSPAEVEEEIRSLLNALRP